MSISSLCAQCSLTFSRVTHRDKRIEPPLSAIHYIQEFCESLDARRFVAMRLLDGALTISNAQHGRKRDTAVSAWEKGWWEWYGCWALELSCILLNTDSPYVYCYMEAGYERGMGDIVSHMLNIDEVDWSFVMDEVIAFRVCMFLCGGDMIVLSV